MRETKKHSLLQAVLLAFSGILKIIKSERNIKIHFGVAFLVVLSGLVVSLSRIEWLIVSLIIFGVLAAETFNSTVEEICNLLREKLNLGYQETKLARDASAGAVLLLAMASVIIGLIIFIPHLFSL